MKPILDLIAGARPNFMKLAPVVRAIQDDGSLGFRIVHTGQHYDPSMNEVFFSELGIPAPDIHLEVGSGTHGAQTARILEKYETELLNKPPDATVVFGDVNSTVACALAAAKLDIPVAHVEAGLRSFDRTMPEEINRILTDAISGLLLVSEPSGLENLRREGVPEERIRLVGNVMMDTLFRQLDDALALNTTGRLGLKEKGYGFVTMHRPSNVDDPKTLSRLLDLMRELSGKLPLVFPMHPRTLAAAKRFGLEDKVRKGEKAFLCLGPLPYNDTLSLVARAAVVLTDSGGLQEETSVLGVPCLTLRNNTERPVTLKMGTSRLVGNDTENIRKGVEDVLRGNWPAGGKIPLWDGMAGKRVAGELSAWMRKGKKDNPPASTAN